ncbi:hypothetical protein [Gemmata sp.]|uniref:hypothetical protein n=1 Tax=Gemmata sp. TaxID=1914242 RepID=UPI003F71117D
MSKTNQMIAKVEEMKDYVFTAILLAHEAGEHPSVEHEQYVRLTTILCYLEERAAR